MRYKGYLARLKAVADDATTEFELERLREDLLEIKVIVEHKIHELMKQKFKLKMGAL